jgi:HPt (histidine-containing phosphotransfer) domain-containing protein
MILAGVFGFIGIYYLYLQKRFQINFLKDNQMIIEQIAGVLETGDIVLAHRLAHTLKSNAALIGKTVLQKAAADANRRLKPQTAYP